jgi:hypothetical protein
MLADMIGGEPVRVVFYCRNWGSICPSHWNQQVRQGSAVPLEETMRRCMEHPRRTGIINYGRKWERWSGVFGKPALNLVSLEALALAKLDTLAHFALTFLGIDTLPPADPAVRRNASLPLMEAEIVRALNQMRLDRTGASDSLMAQRFMAHKADLRLMAVQAAMLRCEDTLTFDENAPALLRLHRRLFQTYGDRLVAPAPQTQFFTPRQHSVRFIRGAYLTMPGVRAELEAARERLEEG